MGSTPQNVAVDKRRLSRDPDASPEGSPGTSPFRQASMRLASSVASRHGSFNTDRSIVDAGLSLGLQPSLATTVIPDRQQVFQDNEEAIEDDNGIPSNSRRPVSSSRSSADAASHSDMENTESISVHSIDIDNPDPHVVKTIGKHLVRDTDSDASGDNSEDKFSSLRLQGGDITRQLYNWQREHEEEGASRKRSRSFDLSLKQPHPAKDLRAPGAFRRDFIAQNVLGADHEALSQRPSPFLTRNFIEFLTLYGHFAGEELEEEEDEDEDDEEDGEAHETTRLLRRHPSYRHAQVPGASATKAVMLLLKSFVGTGVLFLPKAFSNGGMLFSSGLLVLVSILSYWCFLLLIWTKEAVGVSSFGDIGGYLYGPKMRHVILASIVLSQIGFAAAYIVFVSENMQAFFLAVSNGKSLIPVETLIWAQMLFFLPFSMIRDIAKLSGTALVADFFIFLGLLYLFGYSFDVLATDGPADIVLFNSKSWTLFIGTAIFTYEGIGLIIPIQESMKHPEKFGPILGGVMIGITVLFVSAGAFLYASFGSSVETVVLLNLPQDSIAVNTIQLLYSAAILLSIPLQLFPAIRILENGLFIQSGKYNKKVKWQKNIFRFGLVITTAFIAWGGADDLDKFVALIGSVACIPLVYIYPAILHIKVAQRSLKFVIADTLVALLGLCAMIYTTTGTVSSWIGS